MATDKLKQIGDAISNDYLGFIPTSNSTKPPHIANGLFRYCIGETCDTKDIHEWMFEDNAKNSIPSEEILEKYEEHSYKELLEEYNQDNTDNEFDEDDFSYFVREEYEKYCDNTDIKEILRTINAEIDYKMCMLGYIKNFFFESEESYL